MADNFNSNHIWLSAPMKKKNKEGKAGLERMQAQGMIYFLIKFFAENGKGFVVTDENKAEFIRVRSKVMMCIHFQQWKYMLFVGWDSKVAGLDTWKCCWPYDLSRNWFEVSIPLWLWLGNDFFGPQVFRFGWRCYRARMAPCFPHLAKVLLSLWYGFYWLYCLDWKEARPHLKWRNLWPILSCAVIAVGILKTMFGPIILKKKKSL